MIFLYFYPIIVVVSTVDGEVIVVKPNDFKIKETRINK